MRRPLVARSRTRASERGEWARAARDQLRSRLEAAHWREVDRLSAARLADPVDLREIGRVELADLLGEDGQVDAERVTITVASRASVRPRLERGDLAADFDYGARQSAGPGASWSAVLRGGAA